MKRPWSAVVVAGALASLSGCGLLADSGAGHYAYRPSHAASPSHQPAVEPEVVEPLEEWPEAADVEDDEECVIKGNISQRTGEHIYHVPGQEYYERTRVDEDAGERWFCSEDEAEEAGWRKAYV